MYKIRFHLARGENFMKWQVKYLGTEYGGDDEVKYVDPAKHQIAMFNAKLKVQTGTSKKIHEGACKTVCAWVQCDEVQIMPKDKIKPNVNDFYVRFNPRRNPEWVDMHDNIMSGEEYSLLVSQDRSLFVVTENHECNDE